MNAGRERLEPVATDAGSPLDAAVEHASWWQRLRDWIWGYDFFISYQWSSGGRYATALANRLREPPEPCDVMLDAAEFAAGGDWRTQAGAALRNTQRLILVGTRGALEESDPVAAEVAAFTRRSRLIVPVVFDQVTLRQQRAGHRVLGFIPEETIFIVEDPACLAQGPSDEAVAAIKRTHRLLRRRSLRTRLLLATTLIVAGTTGFGGWVALGRWQEFQRGVTATAAMLARAEAALAVDDVEVAETVLTEAARRLRDGATDDLRNRVAARRADLERLRELLAIEDASWAITDGRLPAAGTIDRRYQDFFARHAVPLATSDPRDVARWISESAIAERLVAMLDLLVARQAEQAMAAVAVLRELDDDPYRRRLREAFATGDERTIAEVLDEPQLGEQSPRLLLAVASSRLAPDDTRLAILLDAWRRHPDDYGILMRLGTLHSTGWTGRGNSDVGRLARISYFRAALAARPGSVAAWNDLASVLADVGLSAEALGAAERAISLDPTDPLPRVNAAVACAQLEDCDAAERHAREAVSLGAGVASTHNVLGSVLMNCRGDARGAIAAFRAAIDLAPHEGVLQYNLGQALRAADLKQDAIAAFRKAVRLDPTNAPAWNTLGVVLIEQHDLEEAAAACAEAVRLDPTFANALVNLGNCRLLQGDARRAIAAYEEAVRHDPGQLTAWTNLSAARRRAGDAAGAAQAADRAAALAAEDGETPPSPESGAGGP